MPFEECYLISLNRIQSSFFLQFLFHFSFICLSLCSVFKNILYLSTPSFSLFLYAISLFIFLTMSLHPPFPLFIPLFFPFSLSSLGYYTSSLLVIQTYFILYSASYLPTGLFCIYQTYWIILFILDYKSVQYMYIYQLQIIKKYIYSFN